MYSPIVAIVAAFPVITYPRVMLYSLGPVHTYFDSATEGDFAQRKARQSRISGISE
jgi:hypothetical protein